MPVAMADAMVVTVDRASIVSARRWMRGGGTTSVRKAEGGGAMKGVESTAVPNCAPPPTVAQWSVSVCRLPPESSRESAV